MTDRGATADGSGSGAIYRFGAFELSSRSLELTRDGEPVEIQVQPARLLALLCERAGELVEREEIRRHLWGAETHVDADQGIHFAVRKVRQALDDDASEPRFVETLPRRGYRFVAPVETIGRARDEAPHTPPTRWWVAGLAASAAVALLVAWVAIAGHPEPSAPSADSTARGDALEAAPAAAREAHVRGAHLAARAGHATRRPPSGSPREATDLLDRAAAELERAIALDPTLAPAHAELARVWLRRRSRLPVEEDLLAGARRVAERAVALAPDAPDAHATLARVALAGWDWRVAERAARRAVELDPSNAGAHLSLATVLSTRGRHEEALAAAERARRLDPASLAVAADLAYFRFVARRFPAAAEAARAAVDLDPGADFHRLVEIEALRLQGDEAGAVAAYDRWRAASGAAPAPGLDALWDDWSDWLDRQAEQVRVSGGDRALIALARGRPDEALGWLERAERERYGGVLAFLAVDPRFDSLRGDARFERLVRSLGLPKT